MSAYFVVRAIVEDPVAFQAYASRSPGVIAKFGGRHSARWESPHVRGSAGESSHRHCGIPRFRFG
jgi:uncharacterized protein (DUF1330 family)